MVYGNKCRVRKSILLILFLLMVTGMTLMMPNVIKKGRLHAKLENNRLAKTNLKVCHYVFL